MSPPSAPLDRFVAAFNENGLLTKVTGCHGNFCRRNWNWESAHAWLLNALTATERPPRVVDRDCGLRCSAFAYLGPQVPVTPFSYIGYQSGVMLAFDANADLWAHVQCMSVTDSFTSARVCCTCSDRWNCPWNVDYNERVYCDEPCTTQTCRQLSAGCGISLFDMAGAANGGWRVGRRGQTDWGDERCDQASVEAGTCNLCKEPVWCDDSSDFGFNGSIATPEDWMTEFFDNDGGRAYGSRQCKWKPSQKSQFVDTIKLRFTRRVDTPWPDQDHANPWNEVNFYVDDEGRLEQAMWDSLVGLVYVRTAGNEYELTKMRELAAHWQTLGYDVPMFAMNAEDVDGSIDDWHPDELPIDLLQPPFSLEQIFAESDAIDT